MDMICIFVKSKLYYLKKQPFESDKDTYIRAWWLINNNKDFNNKDDISSSIIYLNEYIYGMEY
jgi:hypothetical protein